MITGLLRTNTWAAIGLSAVLTAALGAISQWQLAVFMACVLGCLMMWKSEVDNPGIPAPDLDDE